MFWEVMRGKMVCWEVVGSETVHWKVLAGGQRQCDAFERQDNALEGAGR